MKVRLIMRLGIADFDGKFVGYEHKTCIVEIDEQFFNDPKNPPEIIGGEWIKNENNIPIELPY